MDHQVISRAAKGFPATHNMWSPRRRGKPLALNATSGEKRDLHLVVFGSTVDLKKRCDVTSVNVVPSIHLSVYSELRIATFEIPNIEPTAPRAKIRYVGVG